MVAMPKPKIKKIVLLLLLVGAGTVIGATVSFFFFNDAPILFGEVIYGVEYKENLTLDIYQPTQPIYSKAPVIVFFHGGAWVMGRKEAINVNRFHGAINTLREQGFALISVEYSLASQGRSPFPYCIEDAFDALDWLEQNADSHGLDMGNVGVMGESAGAQIAMMLAYTSAKENFPRATISPQYVVDIYGPTDLQGLYEMPLVDSLDQYLTKVPDAIRKKVDIAHYLFGFDPQADSTQTVKFAQQYSPIHHLSKNAPPTLIIHGNKDRVVPVEQSYALHQKLNDLQVDAELHIVDGMDHALGNATPEQKLAVQKWIVAFIEKHTSPAE